MNKKIVIVLFTVFLSFSTFSCRHNFNNYNFAGFEDNKMSYRVRYSNKNRENFMDIRYITPKNPKDFDSTDSFPVNIYLHGGFWIAGESREDDPVFSCVPDVDEGVDISVNYRLTSVISSVSYKDMIDDILMAVTYIKEHKEELHLDTSKLTIGGFSAGGHLALLYAYMSTDGSINSPIPVAAVVSDSGPADFTDPQFMSGNNTAIMKKFYILITRMITGADIDEIDGIQEKYNYDILNASPCTHITKKAPPTMMLYGENDQFVPPSNSKRLDQKLTKYGIEHTYNLYSDKGHGCFSRSIQAEVADFIKQSLEKF